MTNKINMPITGIASFAKYPICEDLEKLDSDIAVLGVPYDTGVGFFYQAAVLVLEEYVRFPHIMLEVVLAFMILKEMKSF